MGTLENLMSEMAASSVRAVRLYPRSHSYTLDDWLCRDLLTALSERRYVVLIDIAETDWSEVDRLCGAYSGISWIVTQTGYRNLRFILGAMRNHANLHCDLSNLSTYLGVEEILTRFDSGRLVFGTGLPAMDPGGPIARVTYTQAEPQDVEAIAHGNLERMLAQVRLGEEGA
jgi:hypothetical protein